MIGSDPEETLARSRMKAAVRRAMNRLQPPRYRRVIEARFGMTDEGELTFEEIASSVLGGVGRDRARQIQMEALSRLRRILIWEGARELWEER